MKLSVVVAQNDSRSTEFLASSLHGHFNEVSVARTIDELRNQIPKRRADVAVVDLELAGLAEVEKLHREFGSTVIVCTHRMPDENLWSDALAAGAVDCCFNDDVRGIVQAAERNVVRARASAA